jgi:deoxyribodipyrimidine photo-lyase
MPIQEERVRRLNSNGPLDAEYVLYWMQASQRAEFNHALDYAVEQANALRTPLVVVFCLVKYAEAQMSQYQFMLEGLRDVQQRLAKMKIGFHVLVGDPESVVPSVASDASMVVVDMDYQRMQRQWRDAVSGLVDCSVVQVESNVVVPVETTSSKEQYSAGTIRPRIHRHLDSFLVALDSPRPRSEGGPKDLDGMDLSDFSEAFERLKVKNDNIQQIRFRGGTSAAKKAFHGFLQGKLDSYAELRSDPSHDYLSHMSPYLHFGQISPVFLALAAMESGSPGAESYVEELVVRRELAMNFTYYNESYDTIESLPSWAKTTLDEHCEDRREYTYTLSELEQSRTHDPYWNAAQREMVCRGKMHGYMRMYWGKKILEWSETPSKAYEHAVYLNNKYELDGRDPNGFAGVAWCFGKHDRAWSERPVFGKIRYMNDRGLERKFDIQAYVEKVQDY